MSLACRRNTYLWWHPTNYSPTVSNRISRWPNDINSAANNAIFKNRMQNIECSFDCVARSAVLLKLNVANIILFNFCEQKFVQHSLITIVINCNGHSLLIFEDIWHSCANVGVRVFCAPNATILFVYIPAKIKISFIWKDDLFFLPKSTSSVSESQAHLAKRKRLIIVNVSDMFNCWER